MVLTGGVTTRLGSRWRRVSRRRALGAVAISVLVHGTLLTACGLWIFSPSTVPPEMAIRTVWEQAREPELTPLEPLPVAAAADETAEGGSSLGLAIFRPAEGAAGDALALEDAVLAMLDDQGPLAATPLDSQSAGLSGGQGQGTAPGQGHGGGTGAGEGAADGGEFFGLPAEGRRVVYVVDASRSMNHPHPGPMKTRFARVKLELVRSISGMRPEQEFFIVYFNDQAWPMPAPTMKVATASAREKYLRWAVEVKAAGQTDPEQALLAALSLRPDVIYFLTDGAFKPKIVDVVRAANQRIGVMIHTIGFGDDGGELLLREIALQNRGSYQFIPGEETEPVSVERP